MTYFSAQHRDPAMEVFEQHLQGVIPQHFGRFIDGEPLNLGEQLSDHMHLHLFVWPPTVQRNMWTLVTAGMSVHRMNVPPGFEQYERIELVMTLPAEWPPIDEIHQMSSNRTETYSWPFDELNHLARLPYLHNTWLGRGHTVRAHPSLDDTYPGTQFSGVLVEAVSSLPSEAMSFEVAGTTVHCFGLYPLYPQELRGIIDRQVSGHEWFHRCFDAGLHEGLFANRPAFV